MQTYRHAGFIMELFAAGLFSRQPVLITLFLLHSCLCVSPLKVRFAAAAHACLQKNQPQLRRIKKALKPSNKKNSEARRLILLTEGHSKPITAKTAASVLRYKPEDVVALDTTEVGKTAQQPLHADNWRGHKEVFAAILMSMAAASS